MTPAAELLMLVAEDLRRTDPTTYAALELATRQGCATLLQIQLGPDASIALGTRDDYATVRWLHSCPLQ